MPRLRRLASIEYLSLQTCFCLNFSRVPFGQDPFHQVILNVKNPPVSCKSSPPIPSKNCFRAALIPHQMCLLQEFNLLLVCGALLQSLCNVKESQESVKQRHSCELSGLMETILVSFCNIYPESSK